jgi:phosphoglycerate dehydrogenase-like enzyme
MAPTPRMLSLSLHKIAAIGLFLFPTTIALSASRSSSTSSSSSLPRILLCDVPANVVPGLEEHYADRAVLDPVQGWTDEQVQEHLCKGETDAFVVRSANTVSAEMVQSLLVVLPPTTTTTTTTKVRVVRVIGRAGVGLDNIDCRACKDARIPVVTAAGANAVAVAEHALSLMLALARRIKPAANSIAKGTWEKPSLVGVGIRGKTLGIVGFGAIGSEVAKIGAALGMNIVVAPPTEEGGGGASSLADERRRARQKKLDDIGSNAREAETLQEMLRVSDFVSVQLPLTDSTRYYIGSDELNEMKPSAMLISVGRGGVVDETALLNSLESKGGIAGAALDVFENEGPGLAEDETIMKLAAMDCTVITPHLGGHTEEAQADVWTCVIENVINALEEP